MSFPVLPDEQERVRALRDIGLLDTRTPAALDRVASLAQDMFETEVAALTLIDAERQVLHACVGIDVKETPRDVAFCNYTIFAKRFLEVPDATKDPRFADNPLVVGAPHIRYYAGAPVIVRKQPLGAVCLVGLAPRPPLGAPKRRVLENLAAVAAREITLSLQVKSAAAQLATLLAASLEPDL